MSDLKHLSLGQLKYYKKLCEQDISTYSSKIAGQSERLKWINKYIIDKEIEIENSDSVQYFESLQTPCLITDNDTVLIYTRLTKNKDAICGYSLKTGKKIIEENFYKFKRFDNNFTLANIPTYADIGFWENINKLNIKMYLNKDAI